MSSRYRNALFGAVKRRMPRMTQMLVQRGGPLTCCDDAGNTAVMWAVDADDLVSLRLLIRACWVLVDMPNTSKVTPLMQAAIRGRTECAKILLEHLLVNVHATTLTGETALSFAAMHGNLEIMTLLLHAGATADSRGAGGKTPLMHACSHGRMECVEALVAWGVDVTLMDDDGKTAFEIAEANGYDLPRCVICLHGLATTGLYHADCNIVHRCCCQKCADGLHVRNMKCPTCRRTIDGFMQRHLYCKTSV